MAVRSLDDAGGMPLFAAVRRGLWSRPDVVRLAGSMIVYLGCGETVLDIVIQADDIQVIGVLLEVGATATTRDNMVKFSVDRGTLYSSSS